MVHLARVLDKHHGQPAGTSVDVLNDLERHGHNLIADHGTVDRPFLRNWLREQGRQLRDTIDLRQDVARLEARSSEYLSTQRDKRFLHFDPQAPIAIERRVVDAMVAEVETGSLLVVGDAGAGKTACLLTLVDRLRSPGRRVWYWRADAPHLYSQEGVLGLPPIEHSWPEIFADAVSGEGLTLVVDALDAARSPEADRA